MPHDARFSRFRYNPPATSAEIEQFEASVGFKLPKDYAEFLRWTNGGVGCIGHTYVSFWRLEELVKWNEGYHVAENAPGLFLFGSDGGDEAYVFDMRTSATSIVKVPFIIMELPAVLFIASSFNGFLEVLSANCKSSGVGTMGRVLSDEDAVQRPIWPSTIEKIRRRISRLSRSAISSRCSAGSRTSNLRS